MAAPPRVLVWGDEHVDRLAQVLPDNQRFRCVRVPHGDTATLLQAAAWELPALLLDERHDTLVLVAGHADLTALDTTLPAATEARLLQLQQACEALVPRVLVCEVPGFPDRRRAIPTGIRPDDAVFELNYKVWAANIVFAVEYGVNQPVV